MPPGTGVTLCLGALSSGFGWPDAGLQVVSEDEIFGPKRSRAARSKPADVEGLNCWRPLECRVSQIAFSVDDHFPPNFIISFLNLMSGIKILGAV